MRFCLIDDDPHLLVTLKRGLEELGHDCRTYQSPKQGLLWMLDDGNSKPDLVLLDVMMPELDGWSFLAKLRAGGCHTPVIYLTARTDVDDRVRGLTLSADDYVIKPFALTELIARSEAVLRRIGYQKPLKVGQLLVHRTKPSVDYAGQRIEVNQREHAFLELICAEPGRSFSRSELLKRIWKIQFDPQTNVVEVFVARLRRKLGTDGAAMIETVVGQGYRINVEGQSH